MTKTAIKYGILTGFAVIIYLMAFYFYDKALMRGAGVLWSATLVYFVGMFAATLMVHKSRVGESELPFQKMVSVPFIVFLITNLYFWGFFYWIMNVYDAELLQLHQELTHQEALEYYKGTEAVREIKKANPEDYTPTLGGSVYRYFFGAIGGFFLSVFIAVVVRRT